jgi:sRNA-binding protein
MTTNAPSKTNTSEKRRGYQEAGQKIELLRAKWPKAFPALAHQVRPLTNSAQQVIIEEFGWSADYARAVLAVWKLRPAYCNAILRYPTRINLDGSPSDEIIDDTSRATALVRLEERAARKAKERAKAERLKSQATAARGRDVLGIEDFTEADLEAIRRSKPSQESEAFNHELKHQAHPPS